MMLRPAVVVFFRRVVTVDDAGELGIHGDVRILIDFGSDEVEFGFKVFGPYILDSYCFIKLY